VKQIFHPILSSASSVDRPGQLCFSPIGVPGIADKLWRPCKARERKFMSLGTILLIILIILLLGGFSRRFRGYGYGYGHGGIGLIGVILIIILVLVLLDRI
jgi:hypothetical protein